jgi:hypothetical protein
VPRAAHDHGALAVLQSRLRDAAFAGAWAWVALPAAGTAVDYALETGYGSSRLGRGTVASASRNAARDVMPSFGKIR